MVFKSNDRLARITQIIIIVILCSQIVNVNNISIAWLCVFSVY